MVLTSFMLLTAIGGISVGMGRVLTTFFALDLGANNAQIGYIAAFEALGRLAVTIPAGFIIARYGARRVYAIASLFPMLMNCLIPWMTVWWAVGSARGLISLAIPFRTVSMNSSFLQQLKYIGAAKAGWYRGAQSFGTLIIGPFLATLVIAYLNFLWSYLLLAVLFGLMAAFGGGVLPGDEKQVAHINTDNEQTLTPAEDQEGMLQQIRNLWKIRTVRDSCIIEFFNSATVQVFTTFILVLALTVAHLPQHLAITLITVQGITTVLASFGLGHLLNHFSRVRIHLLSVVLAISGLAILGTSVSYAILVLGTVLLASGSALIGLSRTLQLSQLAVSKSKIAGIYNLTNMSGSFMGAMGGGLLGEWIGLQGLFLIWIPIFLLVGWKTVQFKPS